MVNCNSTQSYHQLMVGHHDNRITEVPMRPGYIWLDTYWSVIVSNEATHCKVHPYLRAMGYDKGRVSSHFVSRWCDLIVIIISRFIQRPQKRSRENQLIHRRLTKT